MKIVCVGDCGIDHYLPGGEKFFGGISANFARCARQAFRPTDSVSLVSVVGRDEDAQIVLSSVEDSGIDSYIAQVPGNTPVQFIDVQADGERRFVRYEEGVLRDFDLGGAERKLISDSDLLVAPVYLQIVGLFDKLMSISTAGSVSIDFADFLQHPDFTLLERYVAGIDIGFFGLSVDDREMISEIEKLAAQYHKLFVVTLGAAGSMAFYNHDRFQCAAVTVNDVVDTTGAGDAYAAGFLSRYCHGAGISTSMAAGADLASRAIQVHGAGILK